jgi:hypothetical protein
MRLCLHYSSERCIFQGNLRSVEYMRKAIVVTCLIFSGLIILDSFNAGHILMMFLLAGVIPGTNIALSATTMMEIFALLTGLVIGRLSASGLRQILTRVPQSVRA